jgi:ribosome-associated protein
VAALVVKPGVVIPASDLSWHAVRSSGPGGQNVNKVASKVELRLNLAGTRALDAGAKARLRAIAGKRIDADGALVVTSQLTRDQPHNLEDARAKLAILVRKALTLPRQRKPTRPTAGGTERRLAAKARRGRLKSARRRDVTD